jgi:hypothetical protein
MSGQHAPVGRNVDLTRIAMMQVIEADTHAKYLVCRGFDPEERRFFDTINVGKPYGQRGTYPHKVGDIIAAARPRTRIGDTPGMAATSPDQPADLNEEIGILYDDNGVVVSWIELAGASGGITTCRFQLKEDLHTCGEALAFPVQCDEGSESSGSGGEVCCEPATFLDEVTIHDKLGVVESSAIAYDADFKPLHYIPAGCNVYCQWWGDTQQWEVYAIGESICSESSESSSSSASESESSSSSESEGSSKSTAIVPASWTPGGYTALFVEECPEVRFDDVLVVEAAVGDTLAPIDPHYLEVCAPDSIEVCGIAPDAAVLVGARVKNGYVVIQSQSKCRVVIRLTGIRSGFNGLRFPDKTREQFEANERFIKSSGNE